MTAFVPPTSGEGAVATLRKRSYELGAQRTCPTCDAAPGESCVHTYAINAEGEGVVPDQRVPMRYMHLQRRGL